MKKVRYVRRRLPTFITTGVASISIGPMQSTSRRLFLARAAAFELARKSAQIECCLRTYGTVPRLLEVLNVSVERTKHKLKVAVTIKWRCTCRIKRHALCDRLPSRGLYDWHSWCACPYLYPDCWSCPRNRTCPLSLICSPGCCLLWRRIVLALKSSERQWRRSLAPPESFACPRSSALPRSLSRCWRKRRTRSRRALRIEV